MISGPSARDVRGTCRYTYLNLNITCVCFSASVYTRIFIYIHTYIFISFISRDFAFILVVCFVQVAVLNLFSSTAAATWAMHSSNFMLDHRQKLKARKRGSWWSWVPRELSLSHDAFIHFTQSRIQLHLFINVGKGTLWLIISNNGMLSLAYSNNLNIPKELYFLSYNRLTIYNSTIQK